ESPATPSHTGDRAKPFQHAGAVIHARETQRCRANQRFACHTTTPAEFQCIDSEKPNYNIITEIIESIEMDFKSLEFQCFI
ncbi:hypothetical protein, partial [Bifidobacterium catulorum]|uniref:hypothetical protein n=1 Tax=Bifidobacterium catulorum TaxID=1630173 RepID=UPI0019D41D18